MKKELKFKKNCIFWSIITMAIIIILMQSIHMILINDKLYTSGQMQEPTNIIKETHEGTKISQEFKAIDNNLEKIKLIFEPFKDESQVGGKIKISLLDEEGKLIKEEEIVRNYVRETKEYEFKFPKQKESKNQRYSINIEFVDLEKSEKFYTLAITDTNEFKENKLMINGEEKQNCSLIFKDYYKSNIRIIISSIILVSLTILIYIAIAIIKNKKDIKVENIFLIISLIIGTFFIITMPTFKNHDEYYHWLKAYEVSKGHLMTPIKENIQGSTMPNSVAEILPNDWVTMDYSELKERLKVPIEKEKQGILNPETAALYSFIPYLPQAIGIAIGRVLTDSIYLITYFGRIANMLVAIGLLYFAIKIMPFGKKLLMIPAMIPIALEGFTSLSPDAITISVSFLFIAYVFNLAFGNKEKIDIKDKLMLLILSIIIALSKIVYLPLVGLILIIPKEKFKNEENKNKAIDFIIIAGIAIILNLIWLKISSRYLANFREGDSRIQVLLALKHPIEYIQKLVYTVNLYGNRYIMSLFGAELGWGELVKIHSIIPYAFLGMYVFTAITDNEIKDKLKKYQKIWIYLVILAIVLLIFTSLYVQWTTVGEKTILGVQGRYFLPIIPLIFILLGNSIKVKSEYKPEKINKYIGILILILNIYTISQIMMIHL